MSENECEGVREVLPELILGVLDPPSESQLRAHLSVCPECQREEGVVRAVLASRPEPPPGLEEVIRERVRQEMGSARPIRETEGAGVIPFHRKSRWVPAWGLSAAAVLVLSLGIGVLWNGENPPDFDQDPIQVVAEEPLPESWLWDDGVVAGAPVYDGLTEEQLEALIEELEG